MKKEINVTQYQEGIFDICESLVIDLIDFLKEEGRYKFRMIDNMNLIMNIFRGYHEIQTEEDVNIYGRVLYVLNRSLMKEYQRLRVKRLTPADSLICIILKLLNLSESLENGENRFKEGQDKIKELIQKFYDNIRNRAKNDHLWKIENSVRDAVEQKKWGTLCLEDFGFYRVEHPEILSTTQDLVGEKNSWVKDNGKEVNL